MKALRILTVTAAMAALLVPAAASEAAAERRAAGGGLRLPPPVPPPLFEFNTGFPGLIVVQREVPVIVEREVVIREVPAAPPPAPPLKERGEVPRKPYVIGASYASLPGGCMKMIEDGASYYYCSGEWYRQVGDGRSASYRAVARKL